MNVTELKQTANHIRKGILRGIHAANSGHPGGSLSSADILTWLYFEELRGIDPADPKNPDRDRFVLSKGHAAPVLYATLSEKGFFPEEELLTLRKIGSRLQGHPDMNLVPGIDMSTGSLGQGLSTAVGMALAGKLDRKDYRVYALVGDGEIQEGQIWEACMFAGFRKLDNLVVILDNNGLQIDGGVDEVCSPYPVDEKFAAFNFHVVHADAHDFESLKSAFDSARETKGRPTAIIAKSVKGKGVSFMENEAGWHGKGPSDEEFEKAMEELGRIDTQL